MIITLTGSLRVNVLLYKQIMVGAANSIKWRTCMRSLLMYGVKPTYHEYITVTYRKRKHNFVLASVSLRRLPS